MTQKTVLLIDDDDDFRDVMMDVLEAEGFKVLATGESSEATDLSDREKVDVAVIDYKLKDTNGFKLATRINSNKKSEIPIIIISSQKSIEEKAKSKFKFFFEKPIDFPLFFKALGDIS